MSGRCAFLTMESTAGWSIDSDLAIEPLQARGWQVDSVPWRSPTVRWSDYDAVYIGTPWDYPQDPQRFLNVLRRVEQAGAILANPLALVRWNINKTYLRDLEKKGAAVVPTVWLEELRDSEIDGLFARCRAERVIVKPTVSTNATDTFLLSRDLADDLRRQLLKTFAGRACMAQPFLPAIQSEGEFSLFYLGGKYSHAIQKRPKPQDFRVQEEHGASITAVTPSRELRVAGEQALSVVQPQPLYARADFVRAADGAYLLMELELIEPSMYLRMHDAAPARFAEAFDHYARARKQDEKAV